MISNRKTIGAIIRQLKVKNTEGQLGKDRLFGINIDKYFMPSVGNVIGADLTKYKIVHRDQFACNRMHVGRDCRLPIALSRSTDAFLVSPAYTVFEIIDSSEILPEYLFMWFSRTEFDREAWFHTDADVRGGLPWDLFCAIELPVPSIEKQRAIIEEYQTVTDRIKLNEQLNQKLEETAQAIYRHWFLDFEFPNEDGQPYKSSGGEMVYNEELDQEIPEAWNVSQLRNIVKINYGKSLPASRRINGHVKVYSSSGMTGSHNKELYFGASIIIGRKGSIGTLYFEDGAVFCIDTAYYIRSEDTELPLMFLFQTLTQMNLPNMNEDSAVPGLNRDSLYDKFTILPNDPILEKYSSFALDLNTYQKLLKEEGDLLRKNLGVVLSKMSRA